jgi:hypothetical protein
MHGRFPAVAAATTESLYDSWGNAWSLTLKSLWLAL